MTDLTLYSMPSSGNSYKVRLLLALLGRRVDTVDVDGVATVDGDPKAHLERCRELLQLEPELLDPEPLIRGEDLVAAGIAPGPAFSKLIKLVRDAQLDGQIDSKAQALDLVRQQQGES